MKVELIRPTHYRSQKKLELYHLIKAARMEFFEGNVYKYLYRAGMLKGNKSKVESLTKAIWYIENAMFDTNEDLKIFFTDLMAGHPYEGIMSGLFFSTYDSLEMAIEDIKKEIERLNLEIEASANVEK